MWVGGQRHAPAALPPGKTRYLLHRRLGVHHGRSGRVGKNVAPTGIRSPVASHYTNWAILAPPFYPLSLFLLRRLLRDAFKIFFNLHTILHHIPHPQFLHHTSLYLHYSHPLDHYYFLIHHFLQPLRNPPPPPFFRFKTQIEILMLLG
jgi:hypothetical protein